MLPPEGERERCVTPQRNLNEGEHEPTWLPGGALQGNEGALEMPPRKQSGCNVDVPPRGNPNEGALPIRDPGGRPPGEGIIGEKVPVKANKSDRGQPAASPTNKNERSGHRRPEQETT